MRASLLLPVMLARILLVPSALGVARDRRRAGGRRGSVVLRARAGSEVEGLSAPLRCWAPSLLCLYSTRSYWRLS